MSHESGCGEGQVTAPHIYEPMRLFLGFFDCKLLKSKNIFFGLFFLVCAVPMFMRLIQFHEDLNLEIRIKESHHGSHECIG